MILFPAVDIKDGRCVRLEQGRADAVTVFGDDPAESALKWARLGAQWLHIIDLDGAFSGQPRNFELVKRICAEAGVPVQLGGGVRDLATAKAYIEAGVSRLIIGTIALEQPELFAEICAALPGKVGVSLDAVDGRLKSRGWVADAGLTVMEGQRPGPSFTADTLTALREKSPEDELTFILGSEAFFALPTWRRGLELPHLCHLAVVLRNGSDPQGVVDFAEKAWPGMERAGGGLLRFATGNSLHIVSMPVFEVSATDIRERWRQRRCLAMLVPPAAEEIMERGGTAYEQAWGRRADI